MQGIMLHNGLTSCNLILCLVLHPSGALGFPLPLLIRRDDEDLPARATALNVFAAFFTIIVLAILAVWLVVRLMHRAISTLSATVTGSSSTSGSDSSDSSDVNYVWTSRDRGYMVSKAGGRIIGEVRRA
ncbi:hypothetical protein QBC47DRAFT_399644 [Echria macrotheca]|uniref:Uncharacterized protein n=1 Tax=Echria macrotheca TaxID=438768 RepID=A0AAJ0FDL7_9PEZI|nr:hypothetical protein QBC47DRAFT_399644 [Echria macrotheca]